MNQQEICDKVKIWCEQKPIKLCVLFGSQATGKAHAQSDVDVAVWATRTLSPTQRLEWVVSLQNTLDREVSLVFVTADLDPVLQFEIARQGIPIFEREAELWFTHRLHLWHAYNDSLPFRRAARQQLHNFAEGIRNAA